MPLPHPNGAFRLHAEYLCPSSFNQSKAAADGQRGVTVANAYSSENKKLKKLTTIPHLPLRLVRQMQQVHGWGPSDQPCRCTRSWCYIIEAFTGSCHSNSSSLSCPHSQPLDLWDGFAHLLHRVMETLFLQTKARDG